MIRRAKLLPASRPLAHDGLTRRKFSLGRLGQGLVGLLLMLPVLSRAEIMEGFRAVSGLDGVRSVDVMADGSVRLQMENGASLSVPAGDVRIASNGEIMVSDRIVEMAGDVLQSAAAGGGGGGAGAAAGLLPLGGMGGGGGGGSSGAPEAPLINRATATEDGGVGSERLALSLPEGTETMRVTLVDGAGNTTVQTVTVAADGGWTFPAGAAALPQGLVGVTLEPLDGEGDPLTPLAAQLRIDTIAPTLAITDVGAGSDGVLNAAEAQAGITVRGTTDAEDGQSVQLTLDGGAYSGTVSGGIWEVALPPAALSGLTDGTGTLSATVTDAAGNAATVVTASLNIDVTAPSLAITDLGAGSDGVLNAAEAQAGITVRGTTDAEDGQSVQLTLDGGAYSGTVSGGIWEVALPPAALSGLTDGTGTLSATVTDAAGNAATVATASLSIDVTAPDIAIPDLADGTTLDLAARDALTGISVTTTAPDGAAVTLSLRRPDGTEDIRVDTVVSSGGSFTIPLGAGVVAALQDLTDYTLSLDTADTAGNPASLSQTLSTDFSPTLQISSVGQDGVFDLADPAGAQVSGQTDGVEAGQAVTVVLSTTDGGDVHTGTATVGADGSWSLALSQAVLTQVEAGTRINVSANVSNTAGRAAVTATDTADAWQAARYQFEAAGPADGTVTVHAYGTEDLSVSGGLAIDTALSFDPALAGFVPGSGQGVLPGLFLIANEASAATGTVSFGGIVASAFSLPAELYEFGVTLSDTDVARFEFRDDEQGGPAALLHGTSGSDALSSGAIDSVLRGGAGDDTLTLGAGAHRVTFETDAGANGHDTLSGFTTGAGDLADQISLTGAVDLRGAGTGVETLAQGDALGVDTGFVIFTTALTDTGTETVEAGFSTLLGVAPSETVYFMAGDGSDAILARIDTGADGTASAQVMADFRNIGDLSALDPGAVILPDPSLLVV